MIYLDNAATSLTKPPEVVQAVTQALTSFGGVGRGAHEASVSAGLAVYRARETMARLLNAPSSSQIAFGANATMALNIAIRGLAQPGCRMLTTAASHNSVLRPMFRLRDLCGCKVDIAPILPDGSLDWDAYADLLARGPRLVAATHASNLTGDVYDVGRMAKMAHQAGALFILDAAQTAGAMPVDMAAIGANVVCFTGHKALLGPQGTGGLAVAEDVEVMPLLEGGSGERSFDERHPPIMPTRLEAGTLNAHGLVGLGAGAEFVLRQGPDAIHKRLSALANLFESEVRDIPGVRILGGGCEDRCAIVALTLVDLDSALVADTLSSEYGIATRAGAHCAPLMHKALGTQDRGAVRFSFGVFNTQEEVHEAAQAMRAIAKDTGV